MGKTPNTSFLKRTKASIISFCSGFNRNLFRPLSRQILKLFPVRPPYYLVCKEHTLWGLHSQILVTRAQRSSELTRRKQRKHWGRERYHRVTCLGMPKTTKRNQPLKPLNLDPRAFSLRKWEGPFHFLREKALGKRLSNHPGEIINTNETTKAKLLKQAKPPKQANTPNRWKQA